MAQLLAVSTVFHRTASPVDSLAVEGTTPHREYVLSVAGSTPYVTGSTRIDEALAVLPLAPSARAATAVPLRRVSRRRPSFCPPEAPGATHFVSSAHPATVARRRNVAGRSGVHPSRGDVTAALLGLNGRVHYRLPAMRQMLGSVAFAVALAITACAGDDGTDDVATDTTEQGATATTEQVVEESGEVPLCTELFAPGQTTDQVLAAIGMDTTENMQTGGECTDEEGEASIHLLAYGTCPSGARVWYIAPYGYGVAGGTWQLFPEGTSPPPTDC
jgi:hypothetical protein